MAQRRFHYEAAFEHYLRANAIPYVAVDEAKRALQSKQRGGIEGASKLKSFDFVVYSERSLNLLVDVKGRKHAGRTGRGFQNWVTTDDVTCLDRWSAIFGDGFEPAFAFLFWCDARPVSTIGCPFFDGDRRQATASIGVASRGHLDIVISILPSESRMANDLLVRDVPEDLRSWLGGRRPAGTSQREFLISILKAARDGQVEPTLFEARQSEPRLAAARTSAVTFPFIDLFAGIGGFRIGMTLSGGRCVFTSEYDKFCQRTYQRWYGEEKIWGDITSSDLDIERDIPDHDVLCAGFPCQPFSIAGVSKKKSLGMAHGFDCEKQGNLFFRVCDIVDVKRPPVLFLENVKNLKSHDKGRTWQVIEENLLARNYRVFSKVIDARYWVPQHRERIFIVCFDKDVFGDEPPFRWPEPPSGHEPKLGDILEADPDPKYVLTDHLWNYLQNYAKKHKAAGNGFGYGLVGPEDVTRTLSARYYKDGSEILIRHKKNPRRLTHREAARLMGYSDDYARLFGHENGFPLVVSDTQGYKQFGNSVVPPVVAAIGREIASVIAWQLARRGNGCLLKAATEPARLKRSA